MRPPRSCSDEARIRTLQRPTVPVNPSSPSAVEWSGSRGISWNTASIPIRCRIAVVPRAACCL